MQELNKQYDRHVSKERLIDKELSSTEGEIEAFQSEKQRALNLIEVTVPLKLNQMKFMKENKLPKDISNALIFTATGLTQLRNRINELGNEKVRNNTTTLHTTHYTLYAHTSRHGSITPSHIASGGLSHIMCG